jgi:hypothetical protein
MAGMGGDAMPPGQKVAWAQTMAKAAKDFQRSGKFEIKAASTPQERNVRNRMKSVIRELLG